MIQRYIRDVPDFPKKGILFKDITPLLQSPAGLKEVVGDLARLVDPKSYEIVCGIESRGFIFGTALAHHLGKGFVPIRKPGKLPWKTASESYQLEYGSDTLEIHLDACKPGQGVLLVDDLLATGGTARAVCDLVESVGGTVAGLLFVVELNFLGGRAKFDGYDVRSLIKYDS